MTEHIVYEDEKTVAFLVVSPRVTGQLRIVPKETAETIENISPEMMSHYFYVASFAASVLFEGLGAEATNIIMNEGAGMPFSIDVIPRKKEDGIDFKWEPKKFSEEEMNGAMQKISWEFTPPENAPKPAPGTHEVSQAELDKKKAIADKDEEDQLVKWYEKTP